MMVTRFFLYAMSLFSVIISLASEFTGPAEWKLVNTNAVAKWQRESHKRADDDFLSLRGVVADKKKMEVRLLAEAVGHGKGTTTEFMLVGAYSDRAYESVAVTVASPADIVRAVEFLGVKRGRCVDAERFQFVPYGERFDFFTRRLDSDNPRERAFSSLVQESVPADPLYPEEGFVFAGGEWKMKEGRLVSVTSTVPPCSVVSLYNEFSIFDMPRQAGQSAVYGRLSIKTKLPYGALLEVVARPVSRESTLMPLDITVLPDDQSFALSTELRGKKINHGQAVKDTITWLRSQSDAGFDLFVTLKFDSELTLRQARDAAQLFEILSRGGIQLYGKGGNGVYYKAFLPQDEWRQREGRNPQPFEVHIARDQSGTIKKRLVFIEEDWSVEGLDPKLIPREYPFEKWSELTSLVRKAGGEDNKVGVLFFFAPEETRLCEFIPGINALSGRLPLVHVFSEQ